MVVTVPLFTLIVSAVTVRLASGRRQRDRVVVRVAVDGQ